MIAYVNQYRYHILLGAILLVHALGMHNDIFNGDSALYASISKNIATSGDWLILNSVMQDNWIDKPHLAFWIWAVALKFFGNTNLGFKLPSFLSLLLLLRYMFLWTAMFYKKETAWVAVLILASSLHMMISTNDVRIDLFLICFMMGAIYHLQQYLSAHHFTQLMLGAVFAALAVMTKGIYVVIPIGVSVIASIIYHRSYRIILTWHWLAAALVFLMGIAPALYALKVQFACYTDSHILGQKPTNYLQFFFWDSQFGRFNSNLGQVASSGDPSYYLHTLLWSFAPWSILLVLVVFLKKNPWREPISISCAAVLLLILSISKTQLSHHILIVLPFFSIILASVLVSKSHLKQEKKYVFGLHYSILGIMVILAIFLAKWVIGEWSFQSIVYSLGLLILVLSVFRYPIGGKLVIITSMMAIYLGLILNSVFYPEILKFQFGRKTSDWVSKLDKCSSVEEFYVNISLLNYYCSLPIKNTKVYAMDTLLEKRNNILITSEYGLSFLNLKKIKYKVLAEFLDFRTTVLTADFLNKNKRNGVCEKIYLVKINPN